MIPENFDLERELREALRPVEPTRDFAAQWIAPERVSFWRRPGIALALAAGILMMFVIPAGVVRHENRKRGEEARDQLIDALRITGNKLQKTKVIVVRQLNRRSQI